MTLLRSNGLAAFAARSRASAFLVPPRRNRAFPLLEST
jgi:hypothetical protein